MTRFIEGLGEVPDEYPFSSKGEAEATLLWLTTKNDALLTYTRLLTVMRSFQVERTTKEMRKVLNQYYALVSVILMDAEGTMYLSDEQLNQKQHVLYRLLAREPLKARWDEYVRLSIPDLMQTLQRYVREGDKERLEAIHARLCAQWEDPAYRTMYRAIVEQRHNGD